MSVRHSTRLRRLAGLTAATALLGGGAVGVAHADAPDRFTSTAPVVAPPAGTNSVAKVTNVRFGRHSGFDRAVIDISGSMPGYSVRYLSSQPRECAVGHKVYPAGTRFLQITLEPAQTHDGSGRDVYVGPGQTQSAAVGLPTIKGMRLNCQFEGQVGVVLGLDHRAGYEVGRLSGPTRLYVDVAHQVTCRHA